MEQVFTKIYETCRWGDNRKDSYKGSSGLGSDVNFNKETFTPFLKDFIKENNIKSVVDLGCGDCRCLTHTYDDLDIVYHGYDVYSKVIAHVSGVYPTPKYEFTHFDFYEKKEEINSADLCILKDVLQHWGLNEIYTLLDYFAKTKKFKYILVCNCCNQTKDDTNTKNGSWRPLSCDYLPLKKYNPTKVFKYSTKEVSLIKCE